MPAADVYAWAAADTATTVEIRDHLRKERGIAGQTICAVGYWTAEPAVAGVA
jgi:NADPH-dependent ferric siderophore reductase